MTTNRNDRDNESRDHRDGSSLPALKHWWAELSAPAKVLIPTTAAVLVFVTANALPTFVI